MNSKCRKSNLVPHRYTLLFAYLPAPVVSIRTWHLKYATAHVFPPFFPLKLSPFPPSLCLFGYSSPPPRHHTHRFSGCFFFFFLPSPRQDAWQGSRWNREQMTNPSLPHSHTPLHFSVETTVLPEVSVSHFIQRRLPHPILTALIFKSAHPILSQHEGLT